MEEYTHEDALVGMQSGQVWLALYKFGGSGLKWHKHRIQNGKLEYEHSKDYWRPARINEMNEYKWKPECKV